MADPTKEEIAAYEKKTGKKLIVKELYEEIVRCERHPKIIYVLDVMAWQDIQCPKCKTLKTLDTRRNHGWDKEHAKDNGPCKCDICGKEDVLINVVSSFNGEFIEEDYVYCYRCRKHYGKY